MSATTGRTHWWAKDCGWWRRERVVELGLEHGPVGPAVMDWLSCEAKAQNDGGWVKTGFRAVARGVFSDDVVTVGHVVSRSVTLGLLDEYEEAEGRFTCRISGWQADQERALAATRKARQRANTPENTGDPKPLVTVGHGKSRSVPKCPPTGQDRTEEQLQPPTPKGEPQLIAPSPPKGNRQRDVSAYRSELNEWVQAHFPGCNDSAVESVIGWVRSRGEDPTPTAVRSFASSAPNFAAALEPAA